MSGSSIKYNDITVIGAAIVDILAGPVNPSVFTKGTIPVKETKLSFGGNALNESVTLARLGKKVNILTKVGKDEPGKEVIDYMHNNGVCIDDVIQEENLVTGMNIVLVDEQGERFFLTNPEGSLRKHKEEDIMPFLHKAADIVCFSGMFASPLLTIDSMERIFKGIKENKNRILVVDMTTTKKGESIQDLDKVLKYVDYIIPNEKEASLLTGESDPLKNAEYFLESGVGCVIIKCGSDGSIIKTKEDTYRIPVYKVKQCIDTTGAGDSYVAGFLWALSEGMSLKDCGFFASAVASCTVEAMGATSNIVSIDEAMRRYNELVEGVQGTHG